jgi:phage gpG-like protein
MPAVQTIAYEDIDRWAGELILAHAADLNYTVPLQRSAVAVKADMRENFQGSHGPEGTPWPALRFPRGHGRGGGKPLLDSGLLMASTTAAGQGHIEEVGEHRLEIGTNLDRAAVHQHGAIIRPTKGKYLAIPMTPQAWRKGSPRTWEAGALFFLKPGQRRKHPFLVEARNKGRGKGARRELVLHYILLEQVKIPARPFVGISEKGQQAIDEIFLKWLEEQAA